MGTPLGRDRCYTEVAMTLQRDNSPFAAFNVLSLDGGGLKGIYSAAVLAALEEDYDVRIADHVDLIVGTSTGGILALGLGASLSPGEMLEFYCDHASTIFPGRRKGPGLVRRRYSSAPLRQLLDEVLGEMRFGQSETRLLVSAYDIDSDDVYLFRTPHAPHLRRDWRVPMVDVALATSAAPGYFAPHSLDGMRLIDGGVFANNPAMLGMIEASRFCQQPFETIRMLSLGTTTEHNVTSRNRLLLGGLLQYRGSLPGYVMRGQSRTAENHPSLLIPGGHFTRVDPTVPAGMASLDSLDPVDLIGRARADSRRVGADLRAFFAHERNAYQPLQPGIAREEATV